MDPDGGPSTSGGYRRRPPGPAWRWRRRLGYVRV